jgi:predicted alpha/beta hydrolase
MYSGGYVTELQIPARDGYELAATLTGEEQAPQAILVISSATGVPRQLYRQFANYAATEHNLLVITYDYRGIGGSRRGSLRGFATRMSDWAILDTAGVLQWVVERYAEKQLLLLGHSYGGQILGLLPQIERVSRVVTVAAQSGYWGLQPGLEKYRVWLYTHLVMPAITGAFGYFPWRRLGGGEDLPYGVALEWASWCRSPRYVLGDTALMPLMQLERVQTPILAYSFADDNWGSQPSVDWMMSQYRSAQVTRRHLMPRNLGLDKVGHFGFFKPKAKTLWNEALSWLTSPILVPS